MITAQNIREKTFATVRRDGYDMDVVDAFLDDLANETEATQKENAVLKSKMKVLVDKIEEYRANEEAAQRALLSAQKLAIQIESDARARAAGMIADAEKQVQAKVGAIAQATKDEENRLAAAKARPPPRNTSRPREKPSPANSRPMTTLPAATCPKSPPPPPWTRPSAASRTAFPVSRTTPRSRWTWI